MGIIDNDNKTIKRAGEIIGSFFCIKNLKCKLNQKIIIFAAAKQ